MTASQHRAVTIATVLAIGLLLVAWSESLVVLVLLGAVVAVIAKRVPSERDLVERLASRRGGRADDADATSTTPQPGETYPKGPAYLLAATGVLALIGVGPLLLYVLLGPEDGNPIGLGLLFFFSAPLVLVGTVVGLAWHLSTGPRRSR